MSAPICERCKQPIRWIKGDDEGTPRAVAVVDVALAVADGPPRETETREQIVVVLEGALHPRAVWSDPDGRLVGYEVHRTLCTGVR